MVKVASAMSAGAAFRPGRARRHRAAGSQFPEALRCARFGINGGDDSIVDGDGDSHVHVIVQADSVCGPARIQARMLQKHARGERHQQVGVGDTNAACARSLQRCRSRYWLSALASTSRVTKKCGTVVQLCVVRSAMMRPREVGTSTLAAFG